MKLLNTKNKKNEYNHFLSIVFEIPAVLKMFIEDKQRPHLHLVLTCDMYLDTVSG